MTITEAMRSILALLPDQVPSLMVAGAAGAYVRAIFAPEQSWKRRMLEGAAGALSAIFLGGIVGHVIDATVGGDQWAYLAAGFVMGEAGIAGIRGLRARILTENGK